MVYIQYSTCLLSRHHSSQLSVLHSPCPGCLYGHLGWLLWHLLSSQALRGREVFAGGRATKGGLRTDGQGAVLRPE